MSEVISRETLRELVADWIAQGKRVIGPCRVSPDRVLYRPLKSADELKLYGYVRPENSIKEFVFPRHEELCRYRLNGKQVELIDAPAPSAEQIIVGARPCDAAALPVLDYIFNWDYKDAFYNRRRQLTTIVSFACTEYDRHCFCTSVGSGPDDERGSDAMLVDLGDGTYEVRSFTDKGKNLFDAHTKLSSEVGEVGPGPALRVDPDAVRRFLATGFDHPLWREASTRCLGCGVCAYTCPTCHCFDIVDEGNAAGGARVRNWDACQFCMFTRHASGHNPRSDQDARQRQRILHKFSIYPEKFGEILCTGCGNCTRNCPVGLGVRPVLEAIQETTAEVDTIEAAS